ncbi:hypothetical protein BC830DRAFT_668575 [Chytriomyces sp. MP71]|nr:hypothetical protein BC830DRAFT_668575 [Chytriomyces sp. MP71]
MTAQPSESFPVVKMSAWVASGVFLNVWARSMARLPAYGNPMSYVAYATLTSAVGYGIHSWEISRWAKLELEKDKLVKRRMLTFAPADE